MQSLHDPEDSDWDTENRGFRETQEAQEEPRGGFLDLTVGGLGPAGAV